MRYTASRRRHGRRRRGGRSRGAVLKWIALLCILVFSLVLLDSKMRPLVHDMAQVQAKNLATRIINNAVETIIDTEGVTYQTLVNIEKADDNTVTSVQADVLKMNRLKAQISNTIADTLSEVKKNMLEVPIGTFLGSNILSGRGPNVKVYISLAGSVVTNLGSTFSSAGINQTLHSIMLNVETDIYVIVPGYSTSTKLKTEICLAQTVIVGTTPESYSNIVASLDSLATRLEQEK